MRPTTLLTLDDALIERSAGAIVVTANERLCAALIAAFTARRTDPAPKILQIDQYLRTRFAELSTRQNTGVLLTPLAQRLAWIERSPPLQDIDPEHLYREIAGAWAAIHDWDLLEHLARFDDNENHRLFRDWAQSFNNVAKARQWVTEPELTGIVAEAIQRRTIHADSLVFVGFDVVWTSLAHLIEATRSAGKPAHLHHPPVARAPAVAFRMYDDPDRELDAAIGWAREILDSGPAQTVCVVVPDASVDHDALVGRLDAGLRPADAYSVASASPYNVSGAIALAEVPVIADALRLLKWMTTPLHYFDVERLLRSPFFSFGLDPKDALAFSLPESYSLARLSRSQTSSPLFDVVGFARRIGLLRVDAAIRPIRDVLRRVGWPNTERLTAESREAVAAFESVLDDLANCAPFVEPGNLATLVAQVELASRRSFAPARPAARLQVLGYLETVGLDFTHMWVTGLDDGRWPAPPRPNPFVPLRLQRAAGIARCDIDGEIAFTRRMTERWLNSARNVVLSHALNRDAEPRRASRLVIDMIGQPVTATVGLDSLGHPFLRRSADTALEVRREPSIGPVRSERLRHRGSTILRDQSACPFRAFARHRLLVETRSAPHSFPDAADRGNAVHGAMRTLFDPAGIDGDPALEDIFDSPDATARAVAAGLVALDHFPQALRDSERTRLRRLLEEWIEVERVRPPFRTIAVERATTLSLGEFEFSLQIDRVDRDGDDVLVLDYKTGDVSANSLFGERPEEPQLPMYALATLGSSAIAFAELRIGRCRLNGWAKRAQSVRGVRLRSPPEEDGDWDRMNATWRRRLLALTEEFVVGVAEVRPRDAKACQDCDLHALCRIREIERIDGD